jgi:lysophospholipase L1-like esterase
MKRSPSIDRPTETRVGSRIAFWMVLLIVLLVPVSVAELGFRWLGAGNPVIYYVNTSYRYAPAPGQHVARRDGATVTIDSAGLRGTREWTAAADLHILFVGDSVTWAGTGIDDHEMFTTLTCAKLTKSLKRDALCGNAGVPGYGVENMTARLAFDHAVDHADVLVVTLLTVDTIRGLNDLQRTPFYSRRPYGPLKGLWEATGFLMALGAKQLIHPDVADAYGPPNERHDGESDLRVASDSTGRLIRRLQAEAAKGRRVLLVFSPEAAELDENEKLPLTQHVRRIIASSGLPYLDLTATVKAAYGNDFYVDGVHLDRRGHEVYAEAIANKLAEY